MIAAALDCEGRSFDRTVRDRLLAEMQVGRGGAVHHHAEGHALLAWRDAQVAGQAAGPMVLFDGELHDREELAARLGVDPAGEDAALYAAAWQRWGEDCDREVLGRYAAILWDRQGRTLRCTSSPIEAPPLHWTRVADRLLVGSTPRALFALGAPRQLNWDKFDDALIGNFADPRAGWFCDIARIPPGTTVRLGCDAVRERKFWSMGEIAIRRPTGDAEVIEQARELVERGIAAATTGFGSPGVALSGGLDSQLVASFVAERAARPVPAFCAAPQSGYCETPRRGTFGDESGHARALAEMYPPLSLHPVTATGRGFEDGLEDIFRLGSLPPPNAGNMVWLHAMLEQAREADCDVLLTGGNGNLTLSHDGMDGFAEWNGARRFARSLREALLLRDDRSPLRRIVAYLAKPMLPDFLLAKIAARREAADGNRFAGWCPMREDHARRSGALDRALKATSLRQRAGVATRAERLAFADIADAEGGDIELALELAHGVALRSPLAYRPLVEFCLSLPADQYLRDGVDRRLARELGRGRIPEQVRNETRRGLQGADWPTRLAGRRGELRDELEGLRALDELDRRIDFARLLGDLDRWDGSDTRGTGSLEAIGVAIPRAIALGRFARFVEGSGQ